MSSEIKYDGSQVMVSGSDLVVEEYGQTEVRNNKPSKRTYEQVYREYHEAIGRADGAAAKMKECNLENKPYPQFFIWPDEAYRIVANLAHELAWLSMTQGK